MNNESSRKLYDALSQRFDLGSYDRFTEGLQDENRRKKIYDAVSGTFDLGDYDTFNRKLGFSDDKEDPPTVIKGVKTDTPEEATALINNFNATRHTMYDHLQDFDAGILSSEEQARMAEVEAEEKRQAEELAKQREAVRTQLETDGTLDRMSEAKKEAGKRKRRSLFRGMGYAAMMAEGAVPAEMQDEVSSELSKQTDEWTQNKLLHQKLDETLDMARQGIINEDGSLGIGDAARGIWDSATRLSNWDVGISDAINGLTYYDLIQKYENDPESLTATEEALLDALAQTEYVKGLYADQTGFWYGVGQSLPQSAAFMAETVINPANMLGQAAMKKVVRELGKRGVSAAARRGAGLAARHIGDVAEAAIGTATTRAGHVVGGAIDRHIGNMAFDVDENGYAHFTGTEDGQDGWESVAKEFGAQFLGGYSEKIGSTLIDPALDVIRGATKGMTPLNRLDEFADALNNTSASKLMNGISTLRRRAHLDSTLAEVLEEEFDMLMNATFIGDNNFGDPSDPNSVFNLQNQLTTIASTMLTMQAIRGVEAGGNYLYKREVNKMVKGYDREAGRLYGEQWGALRDDIDSKSPQEVVQSLTDVFMSQDLTLEQKRAVLNYAMGRIGLQSYNVTDKKVRDEVYEEKRNVLDAYDAGRKAQLPQFYHIQEEYRNAEAAIDEQENADEVWGVVNALRHATADQHRDILGQLSEEQQQLVWNFMYSSSRLGGALNHRAEQIEDLVDEFAGQVAPFVVEDEQGNHTVTTAVYGDNAVYIKSQDADGNAVIETGDGRRSMVKMQDLEVVQTHDADELIERFRQQTKAAVDAETEKNLSYPSEVKEPAVGVQVDTMDGKQWMVTAVNGDEVTLQEAVLDKKSGQLVPGGEPKTQSRTEFMDWQKAELERKQSGTYEQGDEMTFHVNGEQVHARINGTTPDGQYLVEIDHLVDGLDKSIVSPYTADELRKLTTPAATASQPTVDNVLAKTTENEGTPSEEIKQSVSGEVTDSQNEGAKAYTLSDEVDENGRQFVVAPNGSIEFGRISSETGLSEAPILLSEGIITNPQTNDGYGLVHIEARHGDQIRKAGYKSVVDFVEEVARNYEVIREGINRNGHQTYMLQLTDKNNNTLMVELSGDGTYWNINTAGIFKTSYGRNRKEVYNRHTTDKQSTETVGVSQNDEQGGTQSNSSMNTPTLQYSNTKGSGNVSGVQVNGQENAAEGANIDASTNKTARERVPKDEKGNPIYEQTDADTAWDAIVEETEGDTEMAQRVAADMLKDKKAALAKLQNGKPKKGATVAEKIANEKAHQAAITQAQNDVAQWEAIVGTEARRREAAMSESDRYAAEMERKSINEGLKALGEPQSLEEYVLGQLAGGAYKLRWSDKENGTKGFGSHTGLSTEEMKARLSMIDNNNGLTPEEIAHSIVENMDASFGEVDVMDVTNMVIDAVATNASRRAMLNGMVESRAELMRQQARAEQEAKDAWYMEQYHATEEELAAYNEWLAEEAEINVADEAEYERRIITFAEQLADEYDNERTDASLLRTVAEGEGNGPVTEGISSVGEEERTDNAGEVLGNVNGGTTQDNDAADQGVLAQSDVDAPKPRRKPQGFKKTPSKSSAELFAEEKQKVATWNNAYSKVIVNSETAEEAIAEFRHLAAKARERAEDWRNRIYKKNKTVVTGQNKTSGADEYETTIEAANERRRQGQIKSALKEAEEYDRYASVLSERVGLSINSDDRQSRIDRAVADYRENVDDSPEAIAAAERDQQRYEADMADDASETVETLENGDVRRTNRNSNGEVATVAIERDGNVISVDTYEDGALFEHTDYDANGNATMVTRYNKDGEVVSKQEYKDGKRKVTANYFEMAEEAQRKRKPKKKSTLKTKYYGQGDSDVLADDNRDGRTGRQESRDNHYGGGQEETKVSTPDDRSGDRESSKSDHSKSRERDGRATDDNLRVAIDNTSLLDLRKHIRDLQKRIYIAGVEKRDAYYIDGLKDELAYAKEVLAKKENNKWGVDDMRTISLETAERMFNEWNDDADVKALFDRVFEVFSKFGIDIVFDDRYKVGEKKAVINFAENLIRLPMHSVYSDSISNQDKANLMLHEMIHGVASYVLHAYEEGPEYRERKGVSLSDGMMEAARQLNEIFRIITRDKRFFGKQGVKSVHEMVSELSDPEFRSLLKETTIWDKIVNALKQLLGIDVENNALDGVSKALDYILNNADVEQYNIIANRLESQSYGASEENLRFRDDNNAELKEKYTDEQIFDAAKQKFGVTDDIREAGRTMWSVDVTPEMRESVMQGQPMFREGMGAVSDREVSYENDPIAKWQGKPRYYGKRAAAFAERERRRMAMAVENTAKKLGLEVEVVTDAAMASQPTQQRMKRHPKAKGWFNTATGEIVVVVPNHVSAWDAVQTVLHEGIGHYGLRELFGENFDAMLDNVYNNVAPELKDRIDGIAERTGVSTRVATEEYLASLAETTNFEEAQKMGWWAKIKLYFAKMLNKLAMPGITLREEITDNELRYMLWKSYQNLTQRVATPMQMIEDNAMQQELKVGRYAENAKTTPMAAEIKVTEPSDIKPVGRGKFGNIYDQFKGKAKEAISFLLKVKGGEAIGALHHPEIGDIDLVWGEEGTGKSDGYGLAKLAKYHGEVLGNLQEILDGMHVTMRTSNRIQLESDTHQAAVRLTWDNEKKNWLLTAFEKKNSVFGNTTDTGETLSGKQNDTATLQNTILSDKVSDNSSTMQENEEEIRYRAVGGNKGYVGYSMSKRAAQARDEGRFPKTDFKREYGISDKVLDALVKLGIINNTEWHHTSKFGNKTTFYGWEEMSYADYYEQHREEIAHKVRAGEIDGLTDEFEAYEEEYERLRREREANEMELTREYGKYREENAPTIPDEYNASNGVRVVTNGSSKRSDWKYYWGENEAFKKYARVAENELSDKLRVEDSRMNFTEWKAKRNSEAIVSEIEREAAALGVPVRIARSIDELPDDAETRKRAEDGSLKGVYSTKDGEVVVYLPNTESANDAKRTILHEIVGHKGLRQLLGEDGFNRTMVQMYRMLPEAERKKVWDAAMRKYGDLSVAMEEYLAEKAETSEKPSWWKRIVAKMRSVMRRFMNVELTEDDINYLLWRSRKRLQGDTAFDMAVDVVLKNAARQSDLTEAEIKELKEAEMRLFEKEGLREMRHRTGDAQREYEAAVSTTSFKSGEAFQDSMLGLKKLQEAIAKESGEEIKDWENPYMAENRMSSVNLRDMELFKNREYNWMLMAVHDLMEMGAKYEDVLDYMMAKHGLERNEVFARRDAVRESEGDAAKEQELYDRKRKTDYAGLTALTGEGKVEDAEAEAQRMVDEFEQRMPAHLVGQLWRATKSCTQKTLEITYNAGLIDKKTYEGLKNQFEYYIPLQGFAETTAEDVYFYIGGKESPYTAPIKAARGRKSKADNPIATIGSAAESAIVDANRNRLKQEFYNMVVNHKTNLVSVSDVWMAYDATSGSWVAQFPDIPNDATPAEVKAAMEAFEANMQQMAQQHPDLYAKASEKPHIPYKVVKNADKNEHQVIVKINGKAVVMTVNGNPRAAQAINGMTNPELKDEWYTKTFNWINRNLSANFTTRNPAFVISNFVRDSIYTNSMVWVKESPAYARMYHKNFGMATVKIASLVNKYKRYEKGDNSALDMNDPMEKMFYEFMTNGGETGYTAMHSVDAYKKMSQKELRKMLRKGALKTGEQVIDVLKEGFDTFGRWAEDTSRFAAYMTSRQMGRSVARSIYDAKEISVNFNKKGAGSKMRGKFKDDPMAWFAATLSQTGRNLYVFWNASVQGLTNFGKAAIDNKGKFPILAMTAMAAGALIPYIFSSDDDDEDDEYYLLPEYVRRNNICIKVGKKMFATLPLPIEIRALYGMGELAYSYLSGKEELSARELTTKIIQQVSQVMPIDMMADGGGAMALVPSALKPIVEAAVNVDWTGDPIYKKETVFNENYPTWMLAYKSTSPELVWLSRKINEATNENLPSGEERTYNRGADNRFFNNPAVWEHIFEGYLGGMATIANQTKKTLMMPFDEDLREVRNVPVVSRFVKAAGGRQREYTLNDGYYEALDIADKLSDEAAAYKREARDFNKTQAEREKAEGIYKEFYLDAGEVIVKANNLKKAVKNAENAHKVAPDKKVRLGNKEMLPNEAAEILKKELIQLVSDYTKGE